MTSKFLSGGGGDLTNGSASLYIASLTVSGLNSSQPVKTNTVNTLVSEKLDIIDVENLQTELNSKIANPLTSDLDFQTFNATDVNSMELNKIATPSNASAGTLKLYANSANSEFHMIDENGVDSVVGGDTFDQSLNTTDFVEFGRLTLNDNWLLTSDTTIGLRVNDENGFTRFFVRENGTCVMVEANNSPSGAEFVGRTSRGTFGAETALLNGDSVLALRGSGNRGDGFTTDAVITLRASENFNLTNQGTEIILSNTQNGTSITLDNLKISNTRAVCSIKQVIGASVNIEPDDSAILDIQSTTQGVLPPRMTTAERDLIVSPVKGLLIFNIDNNLLQRFDGLSWKNNQSIDTTDDVEFKSVSMGDYVIEDVSGTLELKQNGDKRISLNGASVDRYHYINGFGPSSSFHYGRGTEASPTAVLNGDVINNQWEYGQYNTVSENIVSQVRTKATENFAVNNLGVEMTFSTTNNNSGPTRTQKLRLDSDGVSLNNAYTMPLTDGTISQVLTTNGGGIISFTTPQYQTFDYGGNINGTDYLVPNGDPNLAANNTLDNSKEIVIPYNGVIRTATYSTISGDITSVLSIYVNGIVIAGGNLTGAQGVLTFFAPVPVIVGDRVALRLTAGTAIGQTNVILCFSNS